MNAHELEEVLKKTTKILAGEDVDVFLEGFAPRVEYDPTTKKPTRIFIPALPENTPESLVRAIHGYIDHECSHIMFSDNEDICDTTKSKLWHYIHNCIEDPRVNKAMGNYYVGSGKNIRAGYQYLFDEKAADGTPNPYDKAVVDADLDALDMSDEKAVAAKHMHYSSLWFAYQMGDKLSGDKYVELDLDRLYAPLEAKMDKRWIDQLKRVNTANDVRNCSEYFEGFFLEEAMPPSPSGGGDGKGKPMEGESAPGDDAVPKTLEEQLADKLAKNIEYGVVESRQGYYWTDRFDKKVSKKDIAKVATRKGVPNNTYSVAAFENQVQTVTNYLTKDLRRLLEERRRRYYIGGYKSGKLNPRALYSVRLGNDRVFKRRNEVRDINAAVSLLIDMSGSMGGGKIMTAMQSAYAFAMVLEQIRVPYEIYGFCTEGSSVNMRRAYEEWAKTVGPDILEKVVNEECPETFYAFKEFDEPFDLVSKQGMVVTANGGIRMIQNEDSKHVKLALQRLSRRPERIKSLFVFSDGQPAFPCKYPKNGIDNLKFFGTKAKEKYDVDIYSIGIQSNSVQKFYPQYKIIKSLPELPSALFEFLRKAI